MKKFYLSMATALLCAPAIMAQEELPKEIYVVGTNNEYVLPGDDTDPAILKDETGDGIYTGKITNPTIILSFRLITNSEVTEWVTPYVWGAPQAKDIVLKPEEPSTFEIVQGFKESFNFTVMNWAPFGEGTISVDWNNKTLSIVSDLVPGENPNPDEPGTDKPGSEPGDKEVAALYLLGGPAGWEKDYGKYKFHADEDDSYVYSGIFYFAKNDMTFRFYNRIGVSIGATLNEGETLAFDFDRNKEYRGGLYFPGEGNWTYLGWEGGYIEIMVDLDSDFVLFTNLPDYTPDDDPDTPDDPYSPDDPDNPDNPDNPENPDDSGVKMVSKGLEKFKYSKGILSAPFETSIIVTDVAGNTVLKEISDHVDLNSLPKGIYYISGKGLRSITVLR